MARSLRFPFAGAEALRANYSQAWQDIFVLSMLDGKRDGRYLEIGGQVPAENNNTYVLDRFFGWTGVTVELDPHHLSGWRRERPGSTFVIADALLVDYERAVPSWFGAESGRLDYLQLDIDPSLNTLAVLKRLPLDTYRFSVITFETDAYTGDHRARSESREILDRYGYELVAPDVCVVYAPIAADPIPFEDWWVDPGIVGRAKIDAMKALGSESLLPQHLLFGG
jgi:hypothetical protein